MLLLKVCLPAIFLATTALASGWNSGYSDYECHGCAVETSGCYGGSCGGSYGSHQTSHSYSHHSSYQKKYKKHQSYKVEPVIEYVPATIIKKTYRKTYHQPTYHHEYNDCGSGGCGGGSKIIKIIKKTTTYDDGCGSHGCGHSYSSYVEPEPIVYKKVTHVVTQPEVVKVVKVVDSNSHYSKPSHGYSGGGGGGYGYGGAYAHAHASAGAVGGGGGWGGYGSGH